MNSVTVLNAESHIITGNSLNSLIERFIRGLVNRCVKDI